MHSFNECMANCTGDDDVEYLGGTLNVSRLGTTHDQDFDKSTMRAVPYHCALLGLAFPVGGEYLETADTFQMGQ
jgi:hypothetical protein